MKKQDNVIIGIYKITNPKGKIYIGQSTNIKNRWVLYERLNCKQQTKLYNSLKKYSWEDHKKEVIEECVIESLHEREIYWKQYYIDQIGWEQVLFHQLIDGNGGIRSKETKQKISKALKGRKFSEEHKKKISESPNRIENLRKVKIGKPFPYDTDKHIGNNYRKGSKMSDEAKNKISEANKGRKHSPEKRKNMGAPKGKKQEEKSIQQRIKKLNKSIIQYDLDGNFIKEWSSIKQARIDTKSTNIAANLSGKAKRTNGYIWKYKEK